MMKVHGNSLGLFVVVYLAIRFSPRALSRAVPIGTVAS